MTIAPNKKFYWSKCEGKFQLGISLSEMQMHEMYCKGEVKK